MTTEAVLVDLDPRATQILRSAIHEPLEVLMRHISRDIWQRSLTSDTLAGILDDQG